MSTEIDIIRTKSHLNACEPEGVCFAINACKLSVTLDNNVVHLEAVEIVSEEKGAELKNGIKAYSANELYEVYLAEIWP